MKKGYTKGLFGDQNKNIHKSRSGFRIRGKWIRRFGMTACLLLVLFGALTVHPVIPEPTKNAEAAVNPATTTLTVTTSGEAAILDITPSSATGTFSSSDTSGTNLEFSVTTDNITGYNLGISHASATSPAPLVNEALSLNLDSLETSVTESQFSTSAYVGRYGYKPSKLNSADNSDYYIPAPTDTSTTLNVTTQANTESDNYTIALGANIDYTKPSGTYTNTFILTAVANNVAYSINYKDSTSDTTLANLPETESASTATASYFTLSSATPTRTGYTFDKWCDGTVTHNATGNDTCSGTTYLAGSAYSFASPSSTSTNVANLYAMWNVKTYSLAITFAGSGVSSVQVRTGSGTSGTLIGTVSSSGGSVSGLTYGVAYYLYPAYTTGHTLSSWAKTDSATNSSLSSTTSSNPTYKIGDGNGAVTITGKLQTYSLAITFANNTGVSSVKVCKTAGDCSGANLMGTVSTSGNSVSGLTYNTAYYLYPTFSSGYTLSSWSKTSSTGSLSSTTSTNPTFTMGAGNGAVTITGKTDKLYIQDFTKAMCSTQASSKAVTVYDKRDENSYTVRYINGNCWMTQNLRFSGTSINSDTTNINTTKTISWGDLTSGNSYDAARYHNSGNTTNGYWYNYAGASAMTITGSSNQNTQTYDICPKNWRLPTNSEFSGITGYSTAFSPVTGGYYNSGSPNLTGYGYWWSATANDAALRYILYWNNSSLNTSYAGRGIGFYVRCIRSS